MADMSKINDTSVRMSDDADDLAVVRDKDVLLSIWRRHVSPEVQTCLDAFNVQSLPLHERGVHDLSWRNRARYPSLKPFFDDVAALAAAYKNVVKRDFDLSITVFEPSVIGHVGGFHRDVLPPGFVSGICIYSAGQGAQDGEFQYIQKNQETFVRQPDLRKHQFYVPDERAISKLDIGDMGVFKCDKEGLIHRGTAAAGGHRWRVLMDVG